MTGSSRPGMLYGKVVRCPYARAKIISIDTTAAETMPGVKAIHIVQQPGTAVFWAGDDVVAIAAIDEQTAEDAARAVKVEYQPLSHLVTDAEPPAEAAGPPGPMGQDDIWDISDVMSDEEAAAEVEKRGVRFKATEAVLAQLRKFGMPNVIVEAVRKAPYKALEDESSSSLYQKAPTLIEGDPDKAFAEADVISQGRYGVSVIAHCCLESHGSIMEWPDDDAERQVIINALKAASGRIAGTGGAAERLGLKRTTLQNKIRRLNVSRADWSRRAGKITQTP